jgi:salicylate hydroxylase
VRVVVIGAGIGGLALAQGLRRTGVDVVVHDRDRAVSATGGYRLHLDAHAAAALRRLLPPELHLAVLASAAHPRSFRRFTLLDARLRPLLVEPQPDGEDALLIGRIPLRRLLARGLDVRFGAEFTAFERDGDAVVARFADGSSDRGDLLVGADGVGSRVAAALAGRPTSHPLGVRGVAGRTPLTPAVRALLPGALLAGPGLALGSGAVAFLSVHDPAAGAAVEAPGRTWNRGTSCGA